MSAPLDGAAGGQEYPPYLNKGFQNSLLNSWKSMDRAVDKAGATVDLLLTAQRDRKATRRFLRKSPAHKEPHHFRHFQTAVS